MDIYIVVGLVFGAVIAVLLGAYLGIRSAFKDLDKKR